MRAMIAGGDRRSRRQRVPLAEHRIGDRDREIRDEVMNLALAIDKQDA